MTVLENWGAPGGLFSRTSPRKTLFSISQLPLLLIEWFKRPWPCFWVCLTHWAWLKVHSTITSAQKVKKSPKIIWQRVCFWPHGASKYGIWIFLASFLIIWSNYCLGFLNLWDLLSLMVKTKITPYDQTFFGRILKFVHQRWPNEPSESVKGHYFPYLSFYCS